MKQGGPNAFVGEGGRKEGRPSYTTREGIVNKVQWKTEGNQDERENLVERAFFFFFYLQDPRIKTERDFQGQEKHREFMLEMGSPGTKCGTVTWKTLEASLYSGFIICKTGLLILTPQMKLVYCIRTCACGGCINDSYDYFVTHLEKAGGKGRRETGRGSGKVSHHKNKTHTQPRGNWKKGQEAVKGRLRSEGWNLGQSIGNSWT